MSDASKTKRLLRRLFKPGTFWKRTNWLYPTRFEADRTFVMPGVPILVRVAKQEKDGIAFLLGPPLPFAQDSFLSWPQGILTLEVLEGTLRVYSKGQLLLTYEPTDKTFEPQYPAYHQVGAHSRASA